MRNLVLKLLPILFLTLANISSASVTSDILCFNSLDIKPIRFELRTYYESYSKWQVAYVKYERSKNPITLVFQSRSKEVLDKGRPYELTTNWLEISEGRISGGYEMVSQGAMVYSMIYTRLPGKKQTEFVLDADAMEPSGAGCAWK